MYKKNANEEMAEEEEEAKKENKKKKSLNLIIFQLQFTEYWI